MLFKFHITAIFDILLVINFQAIVQQLDGLLSYDYAYLQRKQNVR